MAKRKVEFSLVFMFEILFLVVHFNSEPFSSWLFLLTVVTFEVSSKYLSSNVSALSFAFGFLLHQMEACP